ncbi:hypothetical protein GBA65_06310 [Rubrobacter marinus]|uniref:Uncharacterized protein n=1 Tax=Rubrobacter marinus TaxID=2653852 RepID=A0A6G8PVF6_9ACTN|nr:hypothetical protein [Rubrobacter marinus]QIN78188.1 hypothetical protein GBA65_06310 [Rubrobacter marinus]
MTEDGDRPASSGAVRRWLDAARAPLGAVFLVAYAVAAFAPGWGVATAVFLGSGLILYAASVPFSSSFHKGLALVALAALGVAIVTGKFDAGEFVGGLPAYFGVVAVLLVLSAAGYPIRAARYTAQIRALMGALTRRGVGPGPTAGVLGHVLGAVLDVGSLVLVDVISRRGAPAARLEALTWAGRAFSFVPLWTTLNLLTATTIELTGVAYGALLAVSLPFVVVGMVVLLVVAQRGKREIEDIPDTPLNRGAAAVLLYPVLLVAAVAVANRLLPGLSLTAAIAITVAVVVASIAVLATVLLRSTSPLQRLNDEVRGSLVSSHAEFAIFVSAGILVLSLEALGALAPLGEALGALPPSLVAPALALILGLGFMAGIHVVPLVLLINTAFPLSEGPSPALWAVAILLGSQCALLLTPFSNSVTMLARLSELHPLEIGPKRNWKFAIVLTVASAAYLTLLTFLLGAT